MEHQRSLVSNGGDMMDLDPASHLSSTMPSGRTSDQDRCLESQSHEARSALFQPAWAQPYGRPGPQPVNSTGYASGSDQAGYPARMSSNPNPHTMGHTAGPILPTSQLPWSSSSSFMSHEDNINLSYNPQMAQQLAYGDIPPMPFSRAPSFGGAPVRPSAFSHLSIYNSNAGDHSNFQTSMSNQYTYVQTNVNGVALQPHQHMFPGYNRTSPRYLPQPGYPHGTGQQFSGPTGSSVPQPAPQPAVARTTRSSEYRDSSRDQPFDDSDDDSEPEYSQLQEQITRAAQLRRGQTQNLKLIASKEAIASLERVDVATLAMADRNCAICYNEFEVTTPDGEIEKALRLPKCKHIFGDICLKKWLEDSDSCPYCRDKLPSQPKRKRYDSAQHQPTVSPQHIMRNQILARESAEREIYRLTMEARELLHREDRDRARQSASFAHNGPHRPPRNPTGETGFADDAMTDLSGERRTTSSRARLRRQNGARSTHRDMSGTRHPSMPMFDLSTVPHSPYSTTPSSGNASHSHAPHSHGSPQPLGNQPDGHYLSSDGNGFRHPTNQWDSNRSVTGAFSSEESMTPSPFSRLSFQGYQPSRLMVPGRPSQPSSASPQHAEPSTSQQRMSGDSSGGGQLDRSWSN